MRAGRQRHAGEIMPNRAQEDGGSSANGARNPSVAGSLQGDNRQTSASASTQPNRPRYASSRESRRGAVREPVAATPFELINRASRQNHERARTSCDEVCHGTRTKEENNCMITGSMQRQCSGAAAGRCARCQQTASSFASEARAMAAPGVMMLRRQRCHQA